MTHDYGTNPDSSGSQGSTAQAVKDEASTLAHSTQEAVQGLAGEAKSQAGGITHEAGRQIRGLLDQTRSDLAGQAGTQQERLAEGLRGFGGELHHMVDGTGGDSGLAADVARQVAARTDSVAGWLEERDPAAVMDDVKAFARRRPGLFIAAAAGLGLLAGRLTRGLKDAPSDAGTSVPMRRSTRPADAQTAGVRGAGAHRSPGAPLTPATAPEVPSSSFPLGGSPPVVGAPAAAAGTPGTAPGDPLGGVERGEHW